VQPAEQEVVAEIRKFLIRIESAADGEKLKETLPDVMINTPARLMGLSTILVGLRILELALPVALN
jgi:hypothetical protein